MKILLAGATGYVGTEVLDQCLKHNYIEHIYCLTRKTLDRKYATHKKVTQVIHEEFSQYPEYLLAKLANYGIEGCIWSVGGQVEWGKNKEEAERIGIHYPIQAANAFASSLAPLLDPNAPPGKQKFPFQVHIHVCVGEQSRISSGVYGYPPNSGRLKAQLKKAIFDIADNSELVEGKRCFEVIALRPGTVLAGGDAIGTLLSEAVAPVIAVDRLAKCAIKMVLEGTGYPGKRIMENKDCLGDDWGMINTLS